MGKLHPDWQQVTWKAAAAELGLSSVWQNARPDATWKSDTDQIIIAECYARIGDLKPGHRRKLAMDALKLLALRHAIPLGQHARFLLVVPEELTGRLMCKGWFPAAIRLAAEVVLLHRDRYRRLHELLTSGRVEIRVVPKDRVFIHGKAGVIEAADDSKMDKLGIPSAVWSSTKKVWIDPKGHIIKTRGAEDIARCPFRIAIVSTGLIFHDSDERGHLLQRKFGTVVLDEAHKARRRGGLGEKKNEPNNLLDFMLRIGPRTQNLLLGTGTPIQTEVYELWDLLRILNAGVDFVVGREPFAHWPDWEKALPVVKGDETPLHERDAWEWLRNPLPPGSEDALFAALRLQLGLADRVFFTDRGFGSLGFLEQQALGQALAPGFLREHNPIVRHTVLRRRQTLEEAGLLEKIGVDIHPEPDVPATAYAGVGFSGLGLLTNHPFDLAYQAAESFTAALKKRTKAAGFMKTLLLQRICSSFASGRAGGPQTA